MTQAELITMVAARAHRTAQIADTTSDDYADVQRWVQLAIRYVQGCEDWSCHKDTFTLSTSTTPVLTAGTYSYAMRTLKSDFRKVQGDSIRYGNTFLAWEDEVEEIDRNIGPNWKDAATGNGVPEFATLLGQSLILAPKPSAAFVAAHSIDGYYYKAESLSSASTTLLFYEDFFPFLVDVALIFGLQQQDDSEFRTQLQYWTQHELPRLRGFDPTPHSDESLDVPDWGLYVEGEYRF